MARRSALLHVMCAASEKVGRRLRRDFGEIAHLQNAESGATLFAEKSAHHACQTLYAALNEARPGYGFLMRAQSEIIGTDKTHRWLINPIAGQANFAHAMPHFSVAIALERKGEHESAPVASVLYNPITDELYHAERGDGAFCNQNRLRVSARRDLSGAVIACIGTPQQTETMAQLHAQGAHVRYLGGMATDFAWGAAGRLDAIIGTTPDIWDMAIATPLITESGGIIYNDDIFIAAGDAIGSQLRSILSGAS